MTNIMAFQKDVHIILTVVLIFYKVGKGSCIFGKQECKIGGPPERLATFSGGWMNVFADLKFTCDGYVAFWTYYSLKPGVFYAGVWRPQGSDSFKLIGKNLIRSTATKGKRHEVIEKNERIKVRKGDVIGIHYPRSTNAYTGGIVPYADSRKALCCGLRTTQLSRFHNSDTREEDIARVGLGFTVSGIIPASQVMRLPALRATIQKETSPPVTVTRPPISPPPPPGNARCGHTLRANLAFSWQHLPKIVGGEEAQPHSWPWMASMRRSNRHYCGGALINDQWIVTAAHCRATSSTKISLGHHRRAETGTQVSIRRIIPHPGYKRGSVRNDIQLIQLKQKVSFSNKIAPICLEAPPTSFPPGTNCISAGWGHTRQGGTAADKLMEVRLPLLTENVCVRAYGKSIRPGMFCAGFLSGGFDTCQGDSGGPLMCNAGNTWYLTGVVSWGRGCARKGYPGVYSSVKHYFTWIKSVIA